MPFVMKWLSKSSVGLGLPKKTRLGLAGSVVAVSVHFFVGLIDGGCVFGAS
jgi:hypothetical protein